MSERDEALYWANESRKILDQLAIEQCSAHLRQAADVMRRLIRLARASAVPEGWQVVPKELTEHMRLQGFASANGKEGARALWRSMLGVAPKPEGSK